MNRELKPCPCCGGKAEFDQDDNGYHWVFCNECSLSTDTDRHDADDCRDRLKAVWNRRTPSRKAQPVPAVPDRNAILEEAAEVCDQFADASNNYAAMALQTAAQRIRAKKVGAAPSAPSGEKA